MGEGPVLDCARHIAEGQYEEEDNIMGIAQSFRAIGQVLMTTGVAVLMALFFLLQVALFLGILWLGLSVLS